MLDTQNDCIMYLKENHTFISLIVIDLSILLSMKRGSNLKELVLALDAASYAGNAYKSIGVAWLHPFTYVDGIDA